MIAVYMDEKQRAMSVVAREQGAAWCETRHEDDDVAAVRRKTEELAPVVVPTEFLGPFCAKSFADVCVCTLLVEVPREVREFFYASTFRYLWKKEVASTSSLHRNLFPLLALLVHEFRVSDVWEVAPMTDVTAFVRRVPSDVDRHWVHYIMLCRRYIGEERVFRTIGAQILDHPLSTVRDDLAQLARVTHMPLMRMGGAWVLRLVERMVEPSTTTRSGKRYRDGGRHPSSSARYNEELASLVASLVTDAHAAQIVREVLVAVVLVDEHAPYDVGAAAFLVETMARAIPYRPFVRAEFAHVPHAIWTSPAWHKVRVLVEEEEASSAAHARVRDPAGLWRVRARA